MTKYRIVELYNGKIALQVEVCGYSRYTGAYKEWGDVDTFSSVRKAKASRDLLVQREADEAAKREAEYKARQVRRVIE